MKDFHELVVIAHLSQQTLSTVISYSLEILCSTSWPLSLELCPLVYFDSAWGYVWWSTKHILCKQCMGVDVPKLV